MNDDAATTSRATGSEPAARDRRLAADLFLDLASSLDDREVIEKVLRRGLTETRSDRATLSRLDADGLVIEATLGRPDSLAWPGRRYDREQIRRIPIVWQCLQELRTVFGREYDMDATAPEFREALSSVHHTANLPLVHAGKAVGLLVLSRNRDEAYDEKDRQVLDALSMAAGLALRNALLFSELEESRGRASALAARLESALAAAEDVSSQLNVDSVLDRLLARAVEAANADGGSLGTPDGDSMIIEAVGGVFDAARPESIVGTRWPLHPSTLEALAAGRPSLLTASEYLGTPEGMDDVVSPYRHFLVVPLSILGEPTALIALGRERDEPFTDEDAASILHFGTLAALRLRNVRLLERSVEAERSRGEFVNTAVHEMRSPLTVISGYSDMALAENFGPLTPALRKAIGTVALKAEEMKRTVDELLTLARLESGSIVSADIAVDVTGLATAAVARAQPQARLLGGDVRLEAEAGETQALGDLQLIPRILDNLLNNALAYGGSPPDITVTVRGDGGRVIVDVHDRGPGIPTGEHEAIFEKFRRGTTAVAGREGSGLGLYLCRGLAQQMGGRLELAETGTEAAPSG